ncbi:unnamed protein product [Psylliodes chrysocephalus]|uniref:Uncharacterized protein n=1 Tax=Psylliodes chrysocephalus TaxID=3402493 RepID=A0A9P0GEM8_9CUCU|nr:unnamed protein product [Psylliodes chrysocephala]
MAGPSRAVNIRDDSSDSDNEIAIKRFKNAGRRDTRPQHYKTEWENTLKGWLKPIKENSLRAKCIACNTEFQADITIIKNHNKSSKHLKSVKKLGPSQPRIDTSFFKTNDAQEKVTRAEIKLAAFISEYNLPMRLSDHLTPLLKDIFPDSKIAKEIQMGRIKCTCVIKNVLGQCHFNEMNGKVEKIIKISTTERIEITTTGVRMKTGETYRGIVRSGQDKMVRLRAAMISQDHWGEISTMFNEGFDEILDEVTPNLNVILMMI